VESPKEKKPEDSSTGHTGGEEPPRGKRGEKLSRKKGMKKKRPSGLKYLNVRER